MRLNANWFGLTDAQRDVIARVDRLVDESIAPRAAQLDRDGAFPLDDIRDIAAQNWLMCTVDERWGGSSYGFHGRDPLAFYLLIEGIARGNPSTAHCFQVHLNTVQMVEALANDDQCRRVFAATTERGLLMVGAGSEPGGTRQNTIARKVPGGVAINGRKHYITNGTHCEWMWILCRLDGTDSDLMTLIRTTDPGVRIDTEFWRPTGMRACVSPMLYLTDCFVPDENIVGRHGQFFADHWLAKINMGFTANYIGGLRAIYDFVVDYVCQRGSAQEQVYQVAVGEMRARIHASQALLYQSVLSVREDETRALLMSNEAKWMAVETLKRVIYLAGQVAGSTALFTDYPLERIIRDMEVHMLHRRHHVGIQLVGQAALGLPYDLNKS